MQSSHVDSGQSCRATRVVERTPSLRLARARTVSVDGIARSCRCPLCVSPSTLAASVLIC